MSFILGMTRDEINIKGKIIKNVYDGLFGIKIEFEDKTVVQISCSHYPNNDFRSMSIDEDKIEKEYDKKRG